VKDFPRTCSITEPSATSCTPSGGIVGQRGEEGGLFGAYAGRYKASYDIPTLIPQVYLHDDLYEQRTDGACPAARRWLVSGWTSFCASATEVYRFGG
jgi:hypothetical protein